MVTILSATSHGMQIKFCNTSIHVCEVLYDKDHTSCTELNRFIRPPENKKTQIFKKYVKKKKTKQNYIGIYWASNKLNSCFYIQI